MCERERERVNERGACSFMLVNLRTLINGDQDKKKECKVKIYLLVDEEKLVTLVVKTLSFAGENVL